MSRDRALTSRFLNNGEPKDQPPSDPEMHGGKMHEIAQDF